MLILIRKNKSGNVLQYHNMWQGRCYITNCSRPTWQFWAFGATLGYGLEHIRRHHV